MRSRQGKTGGASRWFAQPTLVKPWPAWVVGAVGCAGASGSFLFFDHVRGGLRYAVPVCIAIIAVAIGAAVWVFLHFQQRAFALAQRPEFRRRFAWGAYRIGCGFVPIYLYFWLHGDGFLIEMTPMLVMVTAVGVGSSIASAGSVRRVGDEQVCAACGYERRTSSERCSECGAFWLRSGGLLRGHRVVQRGAVAAGVIVALVGMASAFPTGFGLVRLGLHLMPDSIRIRMATAGSTWRSEGKLKDLLAGRLTPDDERSLATRLLDQRAEEQGLSSTAVTWLERKVLAGRLTVPIRERFYSEMVEIWLEGPDRVVAGEPFYPLIATKGREVSAWSSLAVQFYLGGVSTDGGKSFEGRCDSVLRSYSASNVWYHHNQRTVIADADFLPRLVIDELGKHEMVIRLWVVVVPRTAMTFSVEWQNDGTPNIPQTAVWTKEIVLRRKVSVARE